MTHALLRDFIASILCFLFGTHGPTTIILPYLFNSTDDAGIAIPTMRKVPYQITKAGDVVLDLSLANDYIAKEDATFPSGKLMFISLWMPLLTFIFLGLFCPPTAAPRGGGGESINNNNRVNRNPNSVANIHAATCTLLTAIGISEFITQLLKYYVGRLRPNFYSMCNFNTATLTCTNTNIHLIYESRLSFPSGHASLSFCGAGCLVLYFIGRCGYLRNNRHNYSEGICKRKVIFLLSFTPLLLSTYCAASRLVDNWHHPSDVLAGMVIGLVCAIISYHIWYPSVTSYHSGIPLSILIPLLNNNNMTTTEEEGSLPLVDVIEGHFGGARS